MIESASQKENIRENIGYLFEPALIEEMIDNGKLLHVPADEIVVDTGDDLPFVPVVIQGSLKISRDHENEELLLYYIETGDTCTMSMQASSRARKSEIRATALEDSTLLMIPQSMMQTWMDRFPSWRNYVVDSYHVRMQELIETIDAIAFMRLDERLEKYLLDQAKLTGSLEIHHTHQQIAEDLHSSRVVISRLLKQLELKGNIRLYRNRIVLKSI
jgi:CRP/FNR family transcriptional regulator